jgi:hypothetical protein
VAIEYISYVEIKSSGNSGSQSITVPDDCTCVVVGVSLWKTTTNWIPVSPISLNSVDLITEQKADDQNGNQQAWLGYLVDPSVGSQTFFWDWGTTLNAGAIFHIIFFKGIETSDPIVSSGKETTSADLTGLTADITDMMVGFAAGYGGAAPSVTDNSQTEILTTSLFSSATAGSAFKLGDTGFYHTGGGYIVSVALVLKKYIVFTLTVSDPNHSQIVDSPVLTQVHNLSVSDCAEDLISDEVAIFTPIVADDASHVFTSESPALIENKTLAVQTSTQDLTSDSPVLFQAHTLSVQDAEEINSVDSLLLVQRHRLTVQDVSHGHSVEGDLILTQVHVPTVQDGIHVFSSDSPALTQTHTLAVQDGLNDQTTDAILLNQKHRLSVQDGASGSSSDSPTLTQSQVIVVQDGTHSHLAENPDLTQAHVLSVSDTGHSLSSDNVTVTRGISLVPADSAHDHTAENVDLEQFRILSVQDGHSSHYVDPIILAQVHSLTVSDSFHAHTADQIIWLESLIEFQSSGESSFNSSSDLDEFQGDKIAEFFSEKVYPDSGTSLAIEEFNA